MMKEGSKDFEPLTKLVRGRISLTRNKRLREALAERGDPATLLAKELPAAVAIEWAEERGPNTPPPSAEAAEQMSKEELRPLARRVARRIEKQGDESENKIVRAARRDVGYDGDADEEAQYQAEQKVLALLRGTDFTKREREFALLFLDPNVEHDEIPELMRIETRSIDRLKAKVVKKLRETAEDQGIRGF
jgi:hypothetical protein